jgi:hypothetical protein
LFEFSTLASSKPRFGGPTALILYWPNANGRWLRGGSVAISAADDLARGVVQEEAEHLDVRFVTACNALVTAL